MGILSIPTPVINQHISTTPLTQTTTFRVVVSDNSCIDSLETTITILTPVNLNAGVQTKQFA